MPRTLYVHAFCVADLDGDGRADFVADPQPRDAFSMTAYVLWNDLPAPLTRARAQVRDASLSAFALDTAADLDSANGLDLVVLAPVPFATSPGATVWLNQGGRLGFTALPQVVVAARSGTLADVDDDGLADLVLVNDVSATVVVMLSQGGGRFGAPITLTGTADGPPIVAHVSCDRRPDIIASD